MQYWQKSQDYKKSVTFFFFFLVPEMDFHTYIAQPVPNDQFLNNFFFFFFFYLIKDAKCRV